MSYTSPHFAIDTSSPSSPASQRSGFPFPAPAEYQRRPSSSVVYQPRRGSTASTYSVASIGGSLDTQPRRTSTVHETRQNAISTLLQPPIVRTGLLPHTNASTAAAGYRAPTTKDIPPVTLTNIPHVPPENFRDYLSRIAPLFENVQRGREEPEQPPWAKKGQETERRDRFAEALDKRGGSESLASPTTPRPSMLSPVESPAKQRRRSSAQPRRNRNEPTPLSTIPSVYFDENFHLENPRTFDVVSERAEIVRPPPGTSQPEQKAANGAALPPRKPLATNAILQEKLSWYMDTVEVHLINNISTASSGFFAALGSLKELQTEAEESVAKIQGLREDLRRLDEEVAVGGLEVAAKRRRRANLQKLGSATAQVQRVVENVKRADELVEEGSFDDAADQMDQVGRLVYGQDENGADSSQLIDLRPLRALQGLDTGLQELQLKIGTGFAHRFITILMDDLREHVEKMPSGETLKRWSKQRGIPPTYMEMSSELRNNLLLSLKGLQRAGYMGPATAAYREAVTKEMKALIRKNLPSSNDEDAESMMSTSTRGGNKLSQQEKSSILARNLRALDDEDAEALLVNVYVSVGEALRRVSTQTKILLDVTSSMEPSEPRESGRNSQEGQTNGPPNISVQEDLSQILDMSSLLGQAVDTAQTQITRVLKVRSEQVVRLSKERFQRYYTLNRLFADECEAVSGRSGQALKGIINAQISGFVQVLGTGENERIAHTLDNDNWNAEDFNQKDDVFLQRILGAMNSDPPEWTKFDPIWEPFSATTPRTNGTPSGLTVPNCVPETPITPGGTKAAAKPAQLNDESFLLPHSAIALLPSMHLLLSLTASLPPYYTSAVATALLEVLRTFNSRTCQLVLGAGATRSAGLKNITTKHLALASQAISFVGVLIAYLRESIRRHLPPGGQAKEGGAGPGGVLAEFDKTKRLFQEHQAGIQDKLVDIMTGRSTAHIKAMKGVDFKNSSEGSVDSTKASPYMETLTKETLTLHRVLGRHLGEGEVGMIMRRIAEAYKEQWVQAFSEVEVDGKGGAGGKKLLQDAEVFEAKLGKVEEFEGVTKEILRVVKERVNGGDAMEAKNDEG